MENNIAIKVENLSKVYKIFDKPADRLKESLNPFGKRYSKDFYALNDISFTVKKGEIIGIIGKNGAGKSTLLKIITGVLTPTSGSVKVNGRIASLLELGAGFNPEMTGIENIYLTGTIMGYSKEEINLKIEKIIEFADIGDFINQPVKMYSSGMFARLAFAVNSYVEPDILIVDEALSVGDVAFQAKCVTRMKQMMNTGVTVFFVTHDMSVIKGFCNSCIFLENGRIKLKGEASEVADVYLREIRNNMNSVYLEEQKENIELSFFEEKKLNKDISFKTNESFELNVKNFRQGTGKAKVRFVEILDINDNSITEVEFDQKIRIRIHLQFYDDLAVGVGYHIRDDKNIEIIGSASNFNSDKYISGKKNEIYIVDFVTRVPLLEGIYNLTVVVSTPVDDLGNTAIFSDLIENAYILKVNARKQGKIWNKVYIPNECIINFLGKINNKKCACCEKENIKYLPLPSYFIDNLNKYGYKGVPEMVNFQEYSCPNCGASDRDRAYALWMKKNLKLSSKIKILDIAPSIPLQKFIRKYFSNAEYKTADLFMENVDYQIDIMNMQLIKDSSFDFFICSHVLEHVRDDIKAMKELKRILKPTGKGILVVPIDLNRCEIDEDPDLQDIAERWRRFGQDDHVRIYSRQGFLSRLNLVGFIVQEIKNDYFDEKDVIGNGLSKNSTIYIVSK